MIRGVVNSDLEATLRLIVRGPNGRTRRITAVIDSGSNGYLSLPLSMIEELGLPWRARSLAELADGSEIEVDTYRGMVVWDRRRCPIDFDASESAPLVGTALLDGFEMQVEFRPRGKVTIKALRRRA